MCRSKRSIEELFDMLSETARGNMGKVVVLRGLTKEQAHTLVSRESCRKGGYIPIGQEDSNPPGIIKEDNGIYSVYVSHPVRIIYERGK